MLVVGREQRGIGCDRALVRVPTLARQFSPALAVCRPRPCVFATGQPGTVDALPELAQAAGLLFRFPQRADQIWGGSLSRGPERRQPGGERLGFSRRFGALLAVLTPIESHEALGPDSQYAAELSKVLDGRSANASLPVGHRVLGVADAQAEVLLGHPARLPRGSDSLPDLTGVVGVNAGGHVHPYLYAIPTLRTSTQGPRGRTLRVPALSEIRDSCE